jgi:hypothetical protein
VRIGTRAHLRLEFLGGDSVTRIGSRFTAAMYAAAAIENDAPQFTPLR